MKKLVQVLSVILLSLACMAQDAPAPATKPQVPPAVPEQVGMKVLVQYHKIMQYQSDYQRIVAQLCAATPECSTAQKKMSSAWGEWETATPGWAKEAGLPVGTRLTVDDNTDKVIANLPPQPEAKK